MQSNDKKKICIVVSSLGKGGAERSSAILSKILVGLGHDVHIVSVLNRIDYSYAGTLLNLGTLKDHNDSFVGRLQRLWHFKKYLKAQQFDLIIDSRSRPTVLKELLISQLLYKKQKVLYYVHSWKLSMYFSSSTFFAKIIYRNALGFVAVSQEIKKQIISVLGFENTQVVYNGIDSRENHTKANQAIDFDEDYILYYGRLDDKVKNISLLMEAYKASVLPSRNIKLLILGDGKDLDFLKQRANTDQIRFKPFAKNPFPYIKHARFLMLTSRFEGFPLVLLEALSIGKPVISVNCMSGPNEIIKHQDNGLLVENNNVAALVKAMNSFIFDTALYRQCADNAEKSVQKFSVASITKQWHSLIEQLL